VDGVKVLPMADLAFLTGPSCPGSDEEDREPDLDRDREEREERAALSLPRWLLPLLTSDDVVAVVR